MSEKIKLVEFSQLIATAIEQSTTDEFPQAIQTILRRLLCFSNLFILEFNLRHAPTEIYSWVPEEKLSKYYKRNYFKFAYQLDPFFQLTNTNFLDGAYSLKQISPDRFFASEYYKSYYLDAKMGDEIGMLTKSTAESVIHLSIGRLNNQQDFSKREIKTIQEHSPLLCALLKINAQHRRVAPTTSEVIDSLMPLETNLKNWCRSHFDCHLTDRESQIAALILQGHSSQSTGLILEIATETVKVHRKNLYRKLKISSQAELFSRLSSLIG